MKQEIRRAMADRQYDGIPIRTLISHNLEAAAAHRRTAGYLKGHTGDVGGVARQASIADAKQAIAETRTLNSMIRNWGPERTRFIESTVQGFPYELSR